MVLSYGDMIGRYAKCPGRGGRRACIADTYMHCTCNICAVHDPMVGGVALHICCICNRHATRRPPAHHRGVHVRNQTLNRRELGKKERERAAGPSCTRGCCTSMHAGAPVVVVAAAAGAAAPSDGARSGRKVGGWAGRSPSARAQHTGPACSREIRARPCHSPGLLPNQPPNRGRAVRRLAQAAPSLCLQ